MTNILFLSLDIQRWATLCDALTARGHTVLHTTTIDAALHAATTQPPALIVCDLQATHPLDALDIAQLRAAPPTSTAPLIAIDGDGTSLDADLHLNGLFDDMALLAHIEALLHVRATISALRLQNVELRTRAEAAETQKQELEAAANKKDEFISFVSHELKNPMASIKGYADLMRRRLSKMPNDPNIKGLDIISQQVLRMTGLLDQLLDFSRISMDRLQLHPMPVNASDLVQRATTTLKMHTDQHVVELELLEAPLVIVVDSVRMGQALDNLLQNAIKFSPEGGIITVRTAQVLNGYGPAAMISVTDQGIGIATEQQPHIFEQFFRASNAHEPSSGMGLGLFIANAIVERHGGHINVKSEEGTGSTFSILLPLAEA